MAEKLPQAVTEAQGKGVVVVELTGEDDRKYYFQKPGKAEISAFITTATKGKAPLAVKNFVLTLAISPSAADLAKEFEEQPGRMVPLNSALQAEVGMNEDYSSKKLPGSAKS